MFKSHLTDEDITRYNATIDAYNRLITLLNDLKADGSILYFEEPRLDTEEGDIECVFEVDRYRCTREEASKMQAKIRNLIDKETGIFVFAYCRRIDTKWSEYVER